MPIFERGDTKLYYEEQGSGFPILLIAPGGMRSTVSFWEKTPWNPIEQLAPNYRVIAMDQRNAGLSVAPIRATDSWQVYTQDQLGMVADCMAVGMAADCMAVGMVADCMAVGMVAGTAVAGTTDRI